MLLAAGANRDLVRSTAPPGYMSASIARGFGGIAQLVEHLLCKQKVTGSNPVASTTCAARRKFEIRDSIYEVRISDGRVAQLVRARP